MSAPSHIDRTDEALSMFEALGKDEANRAVGWIIGADPDLVIETIRRMANYDKRWSGAESSAPTHQGTR